MQTTARAALPSHAVAGPAERTAPVGTHRLAQVPTDPSPVAAAAGVMSAVTSIVTEAHAMGLALLLVAMLLELVTGDHKVRKNGRKVPSTTEDLRGKLRRLVVVLSAWMMDAFMVTAATASGIGGDFPQRGPVLGLTIAWLFYKELRQVLTNVQSQEPEPIIPPQLVAAVDREKQEQEPQP